MNSSGRSPDRLKGSLKEIATIRNGTARYIPCAIKNGSLTAIAKAKEVWSPSSPECQECNELCRP